MILTNNKIIHWTTFVKVLRQRKEKRDGAVDLKANLQ